ncbi:RNA-directed DNA polymerase [Flavobacterium sp. ANB]|uniref:RNA-directed DNA polymerase n=1 Tax=unclassified Flavobacterium TaxID=196869 RepID=UPI0012B6DF82|nr:MULTISPECIES: RNA-directed DNA polymerase [unclassified Flavobacterium]MBF4518942.1 RNA-directed DNA polymerase [Flavobacterium sp. ANB]MTD71552.1 hypothetical protein [Flavobacterium sp. LC2016-13]
MNDLESKFLNEENFYIAFKKLNNYLKQSNEWYNPVELSTFEANLSTNLSKIRTALKDGNYQPSRIEPLPFPKKNDSDGNSRIRQYFRISLSDQIVWIAITNIIGVYLEPKMPFWSYGNRLFVPTWFEEQDGKLNIKRGALRNTSANYYRKWNQSWPLYRRHISMTIKIMALNSGFKSENLETDIERDIYKNESDNNFLEYPFLKEEFWKKGKKKELFWTGLDYEKFFPSINPEKIISIIESSIVRPDGTSRDDTHILFDTIRKMLRFPIDLSGWNVDDLEVFDNNFAVNREEFYGVPTGLLSAGFLANVAMIDVDQALMEYINDNRDVAIFKFVDDQIVLAKSKKSLLNFLNYYSVILRESETGVGFQKEKIFPENSFIISDRNQFSYNKKDDFKVPSLNIYFPEPLMTHTLQKMSNLNEADYELIDDEEVSNIESDLEHFLLADFPDSEMRRDTRMAFASYKLCQLAKQIKPNFRLLDPTSKENLEQARAIFANYAESKKAKFKTLTNKNEEVLNISRNIVEEKLTWEIVRVNKRFANIFNLLLKASQENPDKLKLWKRCIEFCALSGYDGLKKLFKTIESVNLNYLGKKYIIAYCLLNINEKLLSCYNKAVIEDNSFWQDYTANKFIDDAIKLKLNLLYQSDMKSFISGTLFNFSFLKNFINEVSIDDLELLNSYKTLGPQGNYYSFEEYLWFLLDCINKSSKQELWIANINFADISEKVTWSLLSMFPSKIPSDIIDKIKDLRTEVATMNDVIFENFEFRNKENGIIYEMFNGRTEIQDKYLKYYPKIENIITHNADNYIPLDGWLNEIYVQTQNSPWIDVRFSEWTCLEIIIQVANQIHEKQIAATIFDSAEDIYKIHPVNFLIPVGWLTKEKLSWDDWKKIVREHPIRINENDLLLSDFRYLPISKLWKSGGYHWIFGLGNFSLVIGLSVLLTQLITKTFEWPAYANKLSFIDQLFSQVVNSIESQPISSELRIVLMTIFSKNDVDFFSNSNISIDDDRVISRLEHFISILEDLQLGLAKDQLQLLNNAPRQLTTIDIDLLNQSKDIY